MNEYLAVLKKYAVFNGRASRREYWTFSLVSFGVSLCVVTIGQMLQIGPDETSLLGDLYSVLVFLPSLGVSIRRAHDTSHSGWWAIVPFYNLYLMLKAGDAGPNKYGPDPYAT